MGNSEHWQVCKIDDGWRERRKNQEAWEMLRVFMQARVWCSEGFSTNSLP